MVSSAVKHALRTLEHADDLTRGRLSQARAWLEEPRARENWSSLPRIFEGLPAASVEPMLIWLDAQLGDWAGFPAALIAVRPDGNACPTNTKPLAP